MYQMLCGHQPFKGKNTNEIFAKIKEGKIPFSEPIWKEISIQAKVLIKKML